MHWVRTSERSPLPGNGEGNFLWRDESVHRVEKGMQPNLPCTPVILLDIDGVMNTTGTCLKHRSGEIFAAEAVMALRWLIRRTRARVVITSTRRRAGLAAMRMVFSRNGLHDVAERIAGLTPLLSVHDTDDLREEEICQWIENHADAGPAVILDDKPHAGPLAARLVLTHADEGLTFELAARAARLLGC
jgi:hypothetical protein